MGHGPVTIITPTIRHWRFLGYFCCHGFIDSLVSTNLSLQFSFADVKYDSTSGADAIFIAGHLRQSNQALLANFSQSVSTL